MAFNWQTFKTRTLTAVIFVVVMLVGLLWNFWSFFILFSIIHVGCWWEYLKLTEKIYKTQIDIVIKYLLIVAGFVVFLFFGFLNTTIYIEWKMIPGFNMKWLFYFLLIICIAAFFQNKKIPSPAKWMAVVGLIYISLSLGLMIGLTNIPFVNSVLNFEGRKYPQEWRDSLVFLPLFTIGCMWINDTMAYIVGSLIGRTQLSSISPKKTWEGTIGGIILCSGVMGYLASIFDEWFLFGQSIFFWIMLALLAATVGIFGDLFESKLKRLADVKDSGHIMPGHGGFLDRFDSLLFAIPFVWLYVYFVMK